MEFGGPAEYPGGSPEYTGRPPAGRPRSGLFRPCRRAARHRGGLRTDDGPVTTSGTWCAAAPSADGIPAVAERRGKCGRAPYHPDRAPLLRGLASREPHRATGRRSPVWRPMVGSGGDGTTRGPVCGAAAGRSIAGLVRRRVHADTGRADAGHESQPVRDPGRGRGFRYPIDGPGTTSDAIAIGGPVSSVSGPVHGFAARLRLAAAIGSVSPDPVAAAIAVPRAGAAP